MVVTRGEAADGAEVLALYERVLAEDRYFITSTDEQDLSPESMGNQIRSFNAQDNAIYLVGRVNRAVVGALKIQGGRHRRVRHLGLLEIFVDAPYRGAGVGRAMMEIVIDWAEANPVLSKLALSVFEDNARAVNLYRTLGFIEEGRRIGQYRERDGSLRSDLLMARTV